MAGRIAGITIEIGGNTTKLQKALSGVDKQLRATQANLKDVNKLLKLNPGNTELLTQKQKNLTEAIQLTKDRLNQLKDAQNGVQKGSVEWDALQREIIETEEELKRQETEEALSALQAQLAEYEKREKISTAKSVFLGGGFDEATAADAANAFTEGDIEKMSAALKKYKATIEAQIKSSLMDANPKPDGGNASGSADDGAEASKFAETLGKMRAEQHEKAKSILDHYTRREKA